MARRRGAKKAVAATARALPRAKPAVARAAPTRKVVKKKKKPVGIKPPVHSLSTLHPGLVPSLTVQGTAFPIHGMSEFEAITSATRRQIYVFTNVGSAASIGYGVSFAKAGGVAVATVDHHFFLPLLANNDVNGGPTSMRSMKCGLDVVCNTQLLSRGGALYTLNSDQRFLLPGAPSTMTADQWNTFFISITSHPKRLRMDYNEFLRPRHAYSHVVDDPRYNDFDEHNGVLTLDEFYRHIAIWAGANPSDRPMSTIVFALESTSAAQLLSFTARGSFFTLGGL